MPGLAYGQKVYNPGMSQKLDKYARDFALWRDWAAINYAAATRLFETGDPFLLFPAATLGHHSLEMYLKSALIANGMTVFDPKKIKLLDPGVNLTKDFCAWGHKLIELANQLEKLSPNFNLSNKMDFVGYVVLKEPMTIAEGLQIFEPFFSELRYPQEMMKVAGLGYEEKLLLDALVTELRHARFHWNRSP
jgi:hypothetical protein